jgi:hypothetical protein
MKGIRMLDLSCTKYPKDSNVISKSDTQQPPLKLAGYMHSLSFLILHARHYKEMHNFSRVIAEWKRFPYA